VIFYLAGLVEPAGRVSGFNYGELGTGFLATGFQAFRIPTETVSNTTKELMTGKPTFDR
jgi:hypothetical protein